MPGENVLTRYVNGRERRGACGVHGDAWPSQVQTIRNAIRRNTMSATSRSVRTNAHAVSGRVLQALIVVV